MSDVDRCGGFTPASYEWYWIPPRERVLRGCGTCHTGTCDTERQQRWNRPGAWIPPEYRDDPDAVLARTYGRH
jgi:hypothetical protein